MNFEEKWKNGGGSKCSRLTLLCLFRWRKRKGGVKVAPEQFWGGSSLGKQLLAKLRGAVSSWRGWPLSGRRNLSWPWKSRVLLLWYWKGGCRLWCLEQETQLQATWRRGNADTEVVDPIVSLLYSGLYSGFLVAVVKEKNKTMIKTKNSSRV